MTYTDLGASSAKRATWRDTDTRPLLQQIVKGNPNATDKELFALFWAEIEDDKDQLKSIAMYWFDLALLALRRKPRGGPEKVTAPDMQTPSTRAEVSQKTEVVKNQIKQRVEQEVKIALLQLEMPNGKTLGDCTRNDCRLFGGWFVALAKKVPPKQIVSQALSEQQVYKLWQAHATKS